MSFLWHWIVSASILMLWVIIISFAHQVIRLIIYYTTGYYEIAICSWRGVVGSHLYFVWYDANDATYPVIIAGLIAAFWFPLSIPFVIILAFIVYYFFT